MLEKLSDKIINYCGTWKSISVISALTIGLVIWGVTHRIDFAAGYWVMCNLYYSIMAIFESEILLMGQKRKSEVDDQRAIETREFVERIECAVNVMSEAMKAANESLEKQLEEVQEELEEVQEELEDIGDDIENSTNMIYTEDRSEPTSYSDKKSAG